MKYINKLTCLLVLATGLFTASCSDKDDAEIPGGLQIDKEIIEMGKDGGSEQLAISASQNWVANVTEPWLMLTPANGVGSTSANVVVDSTFMAGRRSTDITFIGDNGQRRTVTVKQFGYGKQIDIDEPTVEIENSDSYDNRVFESLITANLQCKIGSIDYSFEGNLTDAEKAEYESEREGWLLDSKNEDKLVGTNLGVNPDRKDRPCSVKFKFRWEMNVVPVVRVAKVHLVPVDANAQLVDDEGNKIADDVVLTVRQKAAQKIEDNRAGDSLSIIMINQKINSMASIETSDNMRNWSSVTLWEATDAFVKSHPEANGRVRSVSFSMFNLQSGESLPKEVKNLKYLESFSISANQNNQIREVDLGEDICELQYLKKLTVYAYGLVRFPSNFVKLGNTLEYLNVVSNNFNKLSDITKVVNKTNFPHLHSLLIYAQRRTDVAIDLSAMDRNSDGNYIYNNNPIGLYGNINGGEERQALLSLLTWENLRDLELSYCFLEGELPADDEMDEALQAAGCRTRYNSSDFSTDKNAWQDKLVGDTCRWLLTRNNPVTCKQKDGSVVYENVYGNQIPRVLPKCRMLALNLNFFTGKVPKWLLYHPHAVEWYPATMVYNQQGKGKDTSGKSVGFSNMSEEAYIYDYYYGTKDPGSNSQVAGVAYPLYYRTYVAAGDVDEASVLAKYKRSRTARK